MQIKVEAASELDADRLRTLRLAALSDSPNAFGTTYGEHRQILELSNEEHFEVYKYVKSKGIDFVSTANFPI